MMYCKLRIFYSTLGGFKSSSETHTVLREILQNHNMTKTEAYEGASQKALLNHNMTKTEAYERQAKK